MPSDISLSIVDSIRLASPCPVRWEDMTPTGGGDTVRHCAQCNLNVHNLTGMGREEAEALLMAHFAPGGAKQGQRVCANWRRRADGTIIFRDCPVGLARVRAAARRRVAALAAAIGVTTVVSALVGRAERHGWDPRQYGSFAMVSRWIGAESAAQALTATRSQTLGGDIAISPAMMQQLQKQRAGTGKAGNGPEANDP